MKQTDFTAFAELMVNLGELYNKSMSESLIELYWTALNPFEFSAIRRAVAIHLTHPERGQSMIKPSDVFRYLAGSAHCKAREAWSKVMHTLTKIGHYESVVFDDALIHAVICDMGGWIKLGEISEDELDSRAQEFEKSYEGYLLNKPYHYPRKLIGIFEADNIAKGFKTKTSPVDWQ